jgi:hypothetical protein
MDRARDKARLAVSRDSDHLRREARGEHERLRLKRGVDQPQHPERDLEIAAADDRGARDDARRPTRARARAPWDRCDSVGQRRRG